MKGRNLKFFGSTRLNFRNKGDAARERRDWIAAEEAYRKHLDVAPSDFAIWIQLGHSLKEQSKLVEAGEAYRRGLALQPDDEDATIHLAHLLKRINHTEEAEQHFRNLFRRSGLRDYHIELSEARSYAHITKDEITDQSRSLKGKLIFIELDDLFSYLLTHRTVSGIQRVQIGIIRHILYQDKASQGEARIFVLNEPDNSWLWQVRKDDLQKLTDYLDDPYVDHDCLRKLLRAARSNAVAVMADAGQLYLILGAFWAVGSVVERYCSLKRRGVVIGTYLYDLIPITHTEFCDEGLPHEFTLSLGDGLHLFDFILTISEYTKSEVRLYMEKMYLPPRPVKTVPLAHANEMIPSKKPLVWGSAIEFLQSRPFVMMVSTIEARKNHNFLIMAWKHFLDEGLDPPDLVFVGREGWRVTSLMELLKTTHYLNDRVHILHDVSDADLDMLYDTCLFTTFPSFVEGWGLPVGESLAHGKPCVASSTSSLPEVGGDLVDYVDPLNLRDGISVLRRMIFDSAYREQRSIRIQTEFRLRTWSDVATDLLFQVNQLHLDLVSNTNAYVLFPAGAVFRPGDLALGRKLPKDYARNPWRLMLVDAWQKPEFEGCWMKGTEASLTFKSDLPPGTGITAYFRIIGAAWASPQHRILITIGPRAAAIDSQTLIRDGVLVRPQEQFSIRVDGCVADDGLVNVFFSTSGGVGREDEEHEDRSFVAGLSFVGYIAHQPEEDRVECLERFLMSV